MRRPMQELVIIREVQREQEWIDCEITGKHLLHLTYNFMLICFSQPLKVRLLQDVRKVCSRGRKGWELTVVDQYERRLSRDLSI